MKKPSQLSQLSQYSQYPQNFNLSSMHNVVFYSLFTFYNGASVYDENNFI